MAAHSTKITNVAPFEVAGWMDNLGESTAWKAGSTMARAPAEPSVEIVGAKTYARERPGVRPAIKRLNDIAQLDKDEGRFSRQRRRPSARSLAAPRASSAEDSPQCRGDQGNLAIVLEQDSQRVHRRPRLSTSEHSPFTQKYSDPNNALAVPGTSA